MSTPQLSYQHAHLFREVEDLVRRLDRQRAERESFVCRGADEAEIVGLAARALRHAGIRAVLDGVIANLETQPDEDWIFRSSLTVRQEPKAMDSVFAPRDQQRAGVFLPYALYALGKLYLNFLKPEVRVELEAAGHDPDEVRLAILIQVVAGARDRDGALGRERTASFSASVYPAQQKCRCNVAFGLPPLATRPLWGGRYQPATVTVERFGAGGPPRLDAAHAKFEWRGGGHAFRQTHKAVLIPEQGLAYEPLKTGAADALECFRVGGEEVCLPVPPTALQGALEIAATAAQHLGGDGSSAWRIDGVLTKDPLTGAWDGPMIVGANQIFD